MVDLFTEFDPGSIFSPDLMTVSISNSGGDVTNDIVFSAGRAFDLGNPEAGPIILTSAETKRIDANWAAGTAQGGFDTGSVANSTWYHYWLIKNPSTGVVGCLISASATSPTMPSGYTLKRRVASNYRTSGSANKPFTQNGDEFLWKTTVLDVDVTNLGTTPTNYTLTVPLGIISYAVTNLVADSATANVRIYVFSTDQNDEAPIGTAAPLATIKLAGGASANQKALFRANTSSQIRAVAELASTTFRVATVGYMDRRGRDG